MDDTAADEDRWGVEVGFGSDTKLSGPAFAGPGLTLLFDKPQLTFVTFRNNFFLNFFIAVETYIIKHTIQNYI